MAAPVSGELFEDHGGPKEGAVHRDQLVHLEDAALGRQRLGLAEVLGQLLSDVHLHLEREQDYSLFSCR